MKRLLVLLSILLSVLILAGCGDTSAPKAENTPASSSASAPKKSIVIYYSWSGTTRRLARKIADAAKADIAEIHTVTPYPTDYNEVAEQAKLEVEKGFMPEIRDDLPNLKDYDVVYLGTPTWWYHISPPLASYLARHGKELEGKHVMPFCTNGGQEGSTLADIAKACPGAKVNPGLSLAGGQVESGGETIQQWIRQFEAQK